MRAISLTQPWAWSILYAGKRIENRSRKDGRMPSICGYRGELLLHASSRMSIADYEAAAAFIYDRELIGDRKLPPRLQGLGDEMLPRGCIVGRARAVGHIEPVKTRGHLLPYFHWADEGDRPQEIDIRWWMGGWALILDDVVPVNWIRCRGALGVWRVPDEIASRIEVTP